MDRRFFSKLLALSAGSAGFWQPTTRANEKDSAVVQNDLNVGPGTRKDYSQPDRRNNEPVTVADFQELARAALPQATYEYITGGSTDEVTLRENVAAFQRIKILPPLLTGVAKADAKTTILKQEIACPVLLAPVAAQNLYHKDGVLAAARAAAAARTIQGVSSSSGNSVEEVAAASQGPKWFQLYVPKDRIVARKLVERAERAGYKAIIVTVDLGERKDCDLRNRFALPQKELFKFLTDVGFAVNDAMTYEQLMAFNVQAWDLALSWEYFDWLRGVTKLPLIIKGVLRGDDAKKAVSLGLDGIIVSNHGGRRLDGVPASIEQLPHIAEAVAGRTEIYLDSGIRRGTDVFKALALGAKAVLIGRPYAWALAANGEAGVAKVLQLLREELESAMLACGCATVGNINKTLLK